MEISQQQMALHMGLPLRRYQEIVSGRTTPRPVHMQAARYALLRFVAEGKPYAPLPLDVQQTVEAVAKKIP